MQPAAPEEHLDKFLARAKPDRRKEQVADVADLDALGTPPQG